jgi:hypothetical protein
VIHDFGIARDLLFVAGSEGLDLQLGQQALDLAVGELRTLDAGRRTDALDRGQLAQGLEPPRRDRPKRAPSPLELIDPGDEAENSRGDRSVSSMRRFRLMPKYTPI